MRFFLLILSLFLLGCQTESAPAPEPAKGKPSSRPRFKIALHRSIKGHDLPREIKAELRGTTVVFHVTDTFGIGSGTVRLLEGNWPQEVLVRYHLGGLEGVSVKVDGKLLLDEKKDPRGPLAVRMFDPKGKPLEGKYLLKKGGYYEARIPPGALADGARELELSWIDFYRR